MVREGWMKDNGLSNVMELIKRQKWENLFKRRELVHIDSVKEFYARMTVIHLKKKDVVKSTPEAEAEEEEKDQIEFDWEGVIDEDAEQGESGSDDQFFYAQVDVKEPVTETQAASAVPVSSTVQQKVTDTTEVDPLCPSGHIPEAVMNKLQAEFERARTNRFQADLEKAQVENARLLALLQQAQTKPKP
ncbi:hypothetical protein Dimus_005971 [Dionaea muscipula]